MSVRRGLERFVTLAFALVAALTLAGCGASSRATGPGAPRAAPAAATPGAADGLPSLDALAARGAIDAPLMRELLRVERAVPRSADVRADRDLCLRATFAASAAARAWFADASGAPSGETTTGTSGTVPPRGPVCAKKGDALHLVVESAVAGTLPGDVTARAVIFAAP